MYKKACFFLMALNVQSEVIKCKLEGLCILLTMAKPQKLIRLKNGVVLVVLKARLNLSSLLAITFVLNAVSNGVTILKTNALGIVR